MKFLADYKVPFYIRIKKNFTIGRSEKELVTANHLVKKLKNNEYKILNGKRYLGKNYYKGSKVSIEAPDFRRFFDFSCHKVALARR